MVDTSKVEQRVDLVKTTGIEIAHSVGGIEAASVADVIRMAELFARAGVMVPPHCRDKPGVCFALCAQAHEWNMPYLGVINKSYVVNNRGVERIAFESQLIHAVIEKNAPLTERLRYEIVGEGDERRCKVSGTFRGSDKPYEYTSETLGKLRDARGRGESGAVKGSPLWEAQPDVQLFYSASRQWARIFCPDVLLGAYTPEDAQYEPVDVTPNVSPLQRRLREAKSTRDDRGFDLAHVERQTGHTVVEGAANTGSADEGSGDDGRGKPELGAGGGQDDPVNRKAGGADAAGGVETGGANPVVGEDAAGNGTARTEEAGKARDAKGKPQQGKRK